MFLYLYFSKVVKLDARRKQFQRAKSHTRFVQLDSHSRKKKNENLLVDAKHRRGSHDRASHGIV